MEKYQQGEEQPGDPTPLTNQPEAVMGYPPLGSKQPDGDENCMPVATGIPPGLECLEKIDQLILHQRQEVEDGDCWNCWFYRTKNKYVIQNNLGQQVFTAKEDADRCTTRNCCGNGHSFDLKINGNFLIEAIHLVRDFACDSFFCPCCLQKLEVMSSTGHLIGRVVQEWSLLAPKFRVENECGETIFKIKGPFSTFSCCRDVEYEVISSSDVSVGKITKKCPGILGEAFSDANNFRITFPVDLDVKVKATLLGAVFLVKPYPMTEVDKDKCFCCCLDD